MKIFGYRKVKHPQGWNYLVAFLDKNKTLNNSSILCAWWDDGTLIKL